MSNRTMDRQRRQSRPSQKTVHTPRPGTTTTAITTPPHLAGRQPTHPQSANNLLHLQRTIGNRAVGRLVGQLKRAATQPHPPTIQRTIMDQDQKLAAANQFTAQLDRTQRGYIKSVQKQLARVEIAERKSPAATISALTKLQQTVDQALTAVDKTSSGKKEWQWEHMLALDGARRYLDILKKEIPPAISDWEFVRETDQQLRDPFVVGNIDSLLSIKNDLRIRFRDTRYSAMTWGSINSCMVDLNEAAGRHIELWKQEKAGSGQDSQDRFMYGDPVTGDIDQKTLVELKAYEADFDKMKSIVDDRALMIALLVPLADEITRELKREKNLTGKQKYEKLLELLTFYEMVVGFKPVSVIPLGILPGETFVQLIGEGHVLDDYGAGIVHGELTHRLQWHALARAMTRDFTSPRNPTESWHYTPFQLYQRMNQPPFSNYRSGAGASKWGAILDRGVTSTDTSYGLPGTFNRDLLESHGGQGQLKQLAGQYMDTSERDKAWPDRPTEGKGAPPTTLPLLSIIGEGLQYQLEERFKAAQTVGKKYDWTGVHPSAAIEQFKEGLLTSGYQQREGYLAK